MKVVSDLRRNIPKLKKGYQGKPLAFNKDISYLPTVAALKYTTKFRWLFKLGEAKILQIVQWFTMVRQI